MVIVKKKKSRNSISLKVKDSQGITQCLMLDVKQIIN